MKRVVRQGQGQARAPGNYILTSRPERVIIVGKFFAEESICSMMKRLRGRNLAHPGCLVGVTLGLALGIILAAILALHNMSLNSVLLIWLGLTVGLGAIGWIVGNRLTGRFPAIEETPPAGEKGTE